MSFPCNLTCACGPCQINLGPAIGTIDGYIPMIAAVIISVICVSLLKHFGSKYQEAKK